MSFQAPLMLLALGALPLVALAQWAARRRGDRYAARFPGVDTLAAVLPAESRLRRRLPLALFAAALAALAVALARPQATVAVPVERASVLLVMDTSGSMRATDVEPTRLAAAQDAARSFAEDLPDEVRLGAVAYSQAPVAVQPPTDNHGESIDLIDSLVADGATATGDGLRTALELLGGTDRDRPPAAIVLLSDGKSTLGGDPVESAADAGRAGVPVYTVALGTPSGFVPDGGPGGGRLAVPPDPRTLERMARASGGEAFAAADADELGAVYERLGSQLGTRAEEREVTAGFAAGGLVLLLAAAALSLRWAGRIP